MNRFGFDPESGKVDLSCAFPSGLHFRLCARIYYYANGHNFIQECLGIVICVYWSFI